MASRSEIMIVGLGRFGSALAVAELRRECPYLKYLGTYPARTTPAGTVDRHGRAVPEE